MAQSAQVMAQRAALAQADWRLAQKDCGHIPYCTYWVDGGIIIYITLKTVDAAQ